MVTIAVLSLSIVLIYQSFFTSLDSLNYCATYLDIGNWANEKIWQTQDDLKRLGLLASIETAGSFSNRNRDFSWNLSYGLIDVESHLYRIILVVLQENGELRRIALLRTAYVAYEEK